MNSGIFYYTDNAWIMKKLIFQGNFVLEQNVYFHQFINREQPDP